MIPIFYLGRGMQEQSRHATLLGRGVGGKVNMERRIDQEKGSGRKHGTCFHTLFPPFQLCSSKRGFIVGEQAVAKSLRKRGYYYYYYCIYATYPPVHTYAAQYVRL